MKLSLDLGRWTTKKAALAVGSALAIAGAVGSAVAIGPTIPAPVKWAGGWELATFFLGMESRYTVPAGRNLLITDVILGNPGSSTGTFRLYSPVSGDCITGSVRNRLYDIVAPPNATTVVPLTTGIGFTSGQSVCAEASGSTFNVNLRGFLFTPAPAS